MDNQTTENVVPTTPSDGQVEQTTTPGVDKNQAGENQQPITQEALNQQTQRSTFDELAAKKGFKSADDLAKSYMELEKSHTKQSMDYNDLLEAKQSASGMDRAVETVQNANPGMEQDEAVKIVQRMIDKSISPIKEQLAIKDTFKTDEDRKYVSQVAELVKKNPTIPWDVALDTVKYREGLRNTQNSVQDTANVKQSASQPDSSSVGMKKGVNIEDVVRDKSIPFSEVQKIMKERFSN